jgi:hypothetical protein
MTATITELAPVSVELANKGLISDELWTRLTNRIVKDEEGMTPALAERIMDQALGFLRLCAEKPGTYSPSPLVDTGWHTFILYTRDYAEFCEKVAGRFIHHNPTDEEGKQQDAGVVPRTVVAMKTHGITVDEPLWATTKADCNCSGGGCNAGPDCDSGD